MTNFSTIFTKILKIGLKIGHFETKLNRFHSLHFVKIDLHENDQFFDQNIEIGLENWSFWDQAQSISFIPIRKN